MKIGFDIGDAYGNLVEKLLEQVNSVRTKQNLPPLVLNQWAKMVFVNALAQDVANVEATA
jgi:hypothetical protein